MAVSYGCKLAIVVSTRCNVPMLCFEGRLADLSYGCKLFTVVTTVRSLQSKFLLYLAVNSTEQRPVSVCSYTVF
jgi:hypothetical protein